MPWSCVFLALIHRDMHGRLDFLTIFSHILHTLTRTILKSTQDIMIEKNLQKKSHKLNDKCNSLSNWTNSRMSFQCSEVDNSIKSLRAVSQLFWWHSQISCRTLTQYGLVTCIRQHGHDWLRMYLVGAKPFLNSLAPGRPKCHFKTAISNLVLLIVILTFN